METVRTETDFETWPLSRVRWGSVLAGAVTFLSVAILLWTLAFAIVSLTGATRAGAVALWICAIVATIIGAAVGGWIAGRSLPASPRSSGMMHGFVAWATALLLAFGTQLALMHGGLFSAASFDSADIGAANGPGATITPTEMTCAGWALFGTWFVSAIVAAMAGAAGSERRITGRISPTREREYTETESTRTPGGPLTPPGGPLTPSAVR